MKLMNPPQHVDRAMREVRHTFKRHGLSFAEGMSALTSLFAWALCQQDNKTQEILLAEFHQAVDLRRKIDASSDSTKH
jgi:hypothetical protein